MNPKAERMYIELMKRSLSGYLTFETGLRISYLLYCMDTSQAYDLDHVINIARHEPENLAKLMADLDGADNYRERVFGFPMTMIGRSRLDNLEYCTRSVLKDDVQGDFMETGVWRGGATIFMKGLLEVLGDESRKVWVVDSFRGLPEPSVKQDEGLDFYLDPMLAVPKETVEENFRRHDLLDENVVFLEGWFDETLPNADVDNLSILRLDGDLYKSTMDVLEAMYEKVSPGGYIIVDDYGAISVCRDAVEDFRRSRNINDPIESIDWTGAYWRKS